METHRWKVIPIPDPIISRVGVLLGVFFSTEGPQGKNTFGKRIQRIVEASFSLALAPQDEDSM
jgi:hypothetical protein